MPFERELPARARRPSRPCAQPVIVEIAIAEPQEPAATQQRRPSKWPSVRQIIHGRLIRR